MLSEAGNENLKWLLIPLKFGSEYKENRMYLESIFIGAEDIRQQLPEEAKKFDGIDKLFKGIMAKTQKDRT